jgi:hypothetical protein
MTSKEIRAGKMFAADKVDGVVSNDELQRSQSTALKMRRMSHPTFLPTEGLDYSRSFQRHRQNFPNMRERLAKRRKIPLALPAL